MGGTLKLGHLSRQNPITGVTEYENGDLKVFADDGHRIASIENFWGITSEGEDRYDEQEHPEHNNGVMVRIRDGYIYGRFKDNPDRNKTTILGEGCTGSIQFYQPYAIEGQAKYGVDIVGEVLGIRTDHIWLTNSRTGTTFAGVDNETVPVGNGKVLKFIHGI